MRLSVRPAREGLVIRDPRTKRPLPAEGGEVPDTTYWRRRLRSGDVVELQPPRVPAAPAPALAATEEK